jgi:diadenosine tetraphosphate (Ap4A) HIT family hydrolase
MTCPLCSAREESVVWRDGSCRVISVRDPDYPGYCRVIWNAHVVEMTDLSQPERDRFLDVVFATEATLRRLLRPDKINLASFGNVVPHLHWHVIPRFGDDRHFPEPVWGTAQREGIRRQAPSIEALAAGMAAALSDRSALNGAIRNTQKNE